ncbi:hypothetical protein TVAG_485510 [Trichomonas vaginalis G3]|uniref:Uncharacterized protein n=1 Tax=Trichomonas vaginalis (strain ATCC PRA-98 / G3) TaxID=412133 RepID=A2G681_TRIV3|nr:hypothetical protein TVAGG3_0113410 [Trichomonas vaginalis G3]EAX87334.1 hypothetical protein TVAG_485510 [Trichomonas vaginalis G3]KAI5545064.1 hypothetical protein TVAGG3_0113410 [Trichomonas vaginalis G3]|eukprot:XP_001300264.1 hypothetical protein [Trichomonas vaginalis G3]
MDEIIQHFDERNEEHLYQVHPEIIEIERPDPKKMLKIRYEDIETRPSRDFKLMTNFTQQEFNALYKIVQTPLERHHLRDSMVTPKDKLHMVLNYLKYNEPLKPMAKNVWYYIFIFT